MSQNSFRIIAGQWRGRRLAFPENTAVRPTGDRVRETVFNWLQPYIDGCRVLDLFAGSGAMGLEALSRDAATVTFVEKDTRLVKTLKQHVEVLAANAEVQSADVRVWLKRPTQRFSLVFLDPPYPADLWQHCLLALSAGHLETGALIYTEQPANAAALLLPPGYSLFKERKAGQVRFMLLRYSGPHATIDNNE